MAEDIIFPDIETMHVDDCFNLHIRNIHVKNTHQNYTLERSAGFCVKNQQNFVLNAIRMIIFNAMSDFI